MAYSFVAVSKYPCGPPQASQTVVHSSSNIQ